MAEVMATFGMAPERILWDMTLQQTMLWYDRATERNYGRTVSAKPDERHIERVINDVNSKLKWNAERNRFE